MTTGTFGMMSGTYAVLSIPVAEKKAFKTADRVWLNGKISPELLQGPFYQRVF